MTTTTFESGQRYSGDVGMTKDTSNHEAEMGSADPNIRPMNGNVSVALVQNVNLPIAEKQTAERVELDDGESKRCCCLLM